ncbi:MAG: SBBP repeat-containing protein [Ignavibacteriota bacterium]
MFSTYLGGDRNDEVRGLALDSGGNIHVTGRVTSTNFPTVNAIQPTFGGSSDGFVAMYAAPNYRLAYSTFLGGAPTEEANALALDAAGNTYITGISQGPGMATVGAYQAITRGSYDTFVAKINAAGSKLEWYTYYGGRADEKGAAIAVDVEGNVLVGGYTTSDNLPMAGSTVQVGLRGDSDAYLAKFSADGKNLLYATFLGSSSRGSSVMETIEGIGVDARGAVTVAGLSNGADFPTLRPIQAYGGGHSDGFIARFSPTLGSLEFSTHIGGSDDDNLLAMALDAGGSVHVAGDTLSKNFPLKNPLRTAFGGAREAFVSKHLRSAAGVVLGSLEFSYQAGQALPAAQTVVIRRAHPFRSRY